MSQEYENGVLKAILERAVNRRRFLAGAGATAAAVGSPLLLSKVAEAANTTSAAPLDVTLPPPITFPGNGIGASFGSYTAPSTPYYYTFNADVFDRSYFPGQIAELKLSFTNAGGPPPAPWTGTDVGDDSGGGVLYAKGQFTVKANGTDIWTGPDGFFYVNQPISGDVTIIARVVSLSGNDGWTKSGVMLRESFDANSPYFNVLVTLGYGARVELRDSSNGTQDNGGPSSSLNVPYWVKLVRSGTTVTGYSSPDGTNWTQIASYTSPIASTAYIGLIACGHGAGQATAVYDNVSVNGVPTQGDAGNSALTVSGNIVAAFSTEAVGDNNGGVQLVPLAVTKTISIPPIVVDPGATADFKFTYDFSDPNTPRGIYALFANLQDSINPGKTTQIWLGNLGVLYPPAVGFKKNSYFMGDTRSNDLVSMEVEAKSLQKVGIKWIRNGSGWDQQEPTQGTYDWSYGDGMVDLFTRHEMYLLWLTNGSPDWARDGVTYNIRNGWNAPDNAVPDDHIPDWQHYWSDFAHHYQNSNIQAINMWNEPWEGGGISGWGGTGQTYRHMIKAVYDAVKPVNPNWPIGGDDSDDNINDILFAVPDWQGLFDLGTQHGVGAAGYYVQRLVPFEIWNTESWYIAQSAMLVQHIMFTLAGGRKKVNSIVLGNLFSNAGDAGGYYGYSPSNPIQFSPQPSAITFSNLTHLLEDTTFLGEPNPGQLPFTFLFQRNNGGYVGVMFGFVVTNQPQDFSVPQWQIKGAGKMRIPDGAGLLTVLDTYGNPYPREKDGSYILPFDTTPIFMTAKTLATLHRAASEVKVLSTNTPVIIEVKDIVRALEQKPQLKVKIKNPLRQHQTGSVQVTLPSGWSADKTTFTFTDLDPEGEKEYTLNLSKATYSDTNKYPITVKVVTPLGTQTWSENIEVHVIAYGTPNIGQASAQDEWKRLGVHPILIGNLTDRAYAWVGLSYDDKNLYFVATVNSPNLNPPVDQTGTWYTLIPPGYGYADGPHWPFDGDNLQLAINAYDNVEDYLYPKSDPYHYRYPSRETDYLFGFYWPTGTNGQVWRYRIPGFPFRHRYPFDTPELLKQSVDPDIKLTVTQSAATNGNNWYTYWATIPLTLLSKLDTTPGTVTKLAIKHSNSNAGDIYSNQDRSVSRHEVQTFQPYWGGGHSVDTQWGFGQKP